MPRTRAAALALGKHDADRLIAPNRALRPVRSSRGVFVSGRGPPVLPCCSVDENVVFVSQRYLPLKPLRLRRSHVMTKPAAVSSELCPGADLERDPMGAARADNQQRSLVGLTLAEIAQMADHL